jgi:2-(1,2-epoxy-1,2-dihydrophenyl)acetyl-CoA isomerase
MKANLNDANRLDLPTYLTAETERYVANSRTVDSQEAAIAFLDKRIPVFLGA